MANSNYGNMYDTLYQYLILHKQLSLPGIGTISLQRHPSQLDFANKAFTPPSHRFVMDSKNDKPSKKLFDWLSLATGVTGWDAIKMVNDFSFDLKNKISSGGKLKWDNVGVLHRDETGNIVLESSLQNTESEQPVFAERVIREHAGHTVKVGEMEKTSTEMEELLVVKGKQRDWGWVIAIVLTVLAIMFTGLYFSEKGLSPAAAGNRSTIHVK